MHPEKNIKVYIDYHISTLFCVNFQCIGAFFVPSAHFVVPHQPNFPLVAPMSAGLPLTSRLRKSQTSYPSNLEVLQENLGSPTFSVLRQFALSLVEHRFLFQCHTESS